MQEISKALRRGFEYRISSPAVREDLLSEKFPGWQTMPKGTDRIMSSLMSRSDNRMDCPCCIERPGPGAVLSYEGVG